MHRNSAVHFTLAFFAAMFCATSLFAQVSLQEQLNAQYKLVKMGSDSGGMSVVEPGTTLTIQKGGVLSVPWKAMAMCPSKFQDNSMHPSAGMCAAMVKSVSKYFQVNDKVYPVKVEVNLEKAKISFSVVACDSCNNVNPPTSMKGEVVFQFAKGYLEKAGAGEVEDIIGQVFAISNNDDQQQGGNQGAGNQGGGNQGGGDQQAGGQDQQQQPQNIEMGMTIDQVQQILGSPQKTVNLGAKQIFVYKDLKVTFLNGKVSDVQ